MPSAAGGEMSPGISEQLQTKDLEAVPLETMSEEDESAIIALRYDGLNAPREEASFHERDEDADELRRKYLRSKKYGAMFVVKKQDKVVGFLALKKNTHEGVVEELWLDSEYPDRAAIRALLEQAEHYLIENNRHTLVIEAKQPSEQLLTECRYDSFKKSTEEKEGAQVHRLEKHLG